MIIIIVNKMSISEHNSEENNISNSNVNNIEEPKNLQEQISGIVEPSTEIPSKYILFKDLAAINELNRTETFINNNSHSDIYRLNSTINHFLSYFENNQNQFLVDDGESPQAENEQESGLFDIDDYYNYNDILSSYLSQRFGRYLSPEEATEKMKNLLAGEK